MEGIVSLATYIQQHGVLDTQQLRAFATSVLQALDHLHQNGRNSGWLSATRLLLDPASLAAAFVQRGADENP